MHEGREPVEEMRPRDREKDTSRREVKLEDLESICRSVPGAVAAYRFGDDGLTVVCLSDALPAMFGHTKERYLERVKGDNLALVLEPDRALVSRSLARALGGGDDVDVSFRALLDGGGYHWMHVKARLVGELDGAPVLIAELVDTSLETRIHECLLDESSSGVYVCDAETRELLYVNQRAREYWHNDGEFLGISCFRFFRHRDSFCPWCAFNDMVGDKAHINDVHDPDLQGALSVDCQKTVWYGRPALSVTFEDLTAKRAFQEATRQAKAELDELVNRIPAALIVYRYRDGRISFEHVSGSVEEIAGIPREVILSQVEDSGIEKHVHPEDVSVMRDGLARLFSSRHEAEWYYRDASRKGSPYRWLHTSARSFEQQDGSQIAYCVLTDVTESIEHKQSEDDVFEVISRLPAVSALFLVGDNGFAIPKTFSDEFCHLLGVTQETAWRLYGTDGYGFIHPDDRARLKDRSDESLDKDVIGNQTFRIVRPDGGILWVSATPKWFRTGGQHYLYSTYSDITALKKEEEELEKRYLAEQTYLESFSDSFIATLRVNVSKDTVESVVGGDRVIPPGTKVPSYSVLVDNGKWSIPRPEDRDAFVRTCSREALLDAFSKGTKTVTLECLLEVAPDKRLAWARGTMNLLVRPETNDVIAFVTIEDIDDERTERRIVERMMSSDECDFIALIDVITRTIDFRNFDEKATTRPITTYRDYGRCALENMKKYVAHDEQEAYLEGTSIDAMVSHLAKEPSYAFAFTSVAGDGQPHRKLMRYSYFDRDLGKVLAIRTDITEAYRKEQAAKEKLEVALREAQAANAAKSDFLSRMSHDIRTPLNGVIGMAELSLGEDLSPVVRNRLEKVDESGKFLLSLVNDILDMSKAESGKIEFRPEPYPYEEFKRYVESVIGPLCEAKGITFEFDVKGLPPTLLVDKLRFNQIFFNLLSNSVKFTPAGGTIAFSCVWKSMSNATVLLHFGVSDNGSGMSREFQKRLFRPFEQEHSASADFRSGSGLGLSIVKRLVDMMGGTISVESAPHEGTRFTVALTLPRTTELPSNASREGEPPRRLRKGAHILLAEDNLINAEVAQTLLEREGLRTRLVTNGRDALDVFEASAPNEFDAILMDVRMPEMDGLEATRRIRALDRTDARAVPIIAMTANAFADDVIACVEAGMDEHVAKPIDPDRLRGVLATYVPGDDAPARSRP